MNALSTTTPRKRYSPTLLAACFFWGAFTPMGPAAARTTAARGPWPSHTRPTVGRLHAAKKPTKKKPAPRRETPPEPPPPAAPPPDEIEPPVAPPPPGPPSTDAPGGAVATTTPAPVSAAAPSEPSAAPAENIAAASAPGASEGATATVTLSPESGTQQQEEEIVDFEAEERAAEAEKAKMLAAAQGGESGGGNPGGGVLGFKLFVDMLIDHRIGDDKFQFRPNHTYVFVQASVYDTVQFMMHISDSPVFFELSVNVLPTLTLTLGKLLVPFGTNEFHHVIGGRVDELSNFLPETWGDYGLSLNHQVYDGDTVGFEYVLYALNGFSGVDEPVIAEGSPTDNNWWKAIGLRTRLTLFNKIKITGSAYGDVWDAENKFPLLFYAAGIELTPGLIDAPVLRRLRLRGEWARGEIRLPHENYQQGIMRHAYARSGFYAEAQWMPFEALGFRLRVGRINPDNRVTDEGDVEVYEPAILVGIGRKLWWTLAYQLVARPGFDVSPPDPPDVIYGKFFLQY